eukprot:COSAG02_NODE_4906_length_4847_cov_7.816133_3_plen_57_part_00
MIGCCDIFWWIVLHVDGCRYRQHEAIQREEEEQVKRGAEVTTLNKSIASAHEVRVN